MISDLIRLDGQILLWIQEHLRCPALDAFFSNFTRLGDHGLIWIALGLLLLLWKRTRPGGLLVLFSLLGSLLVNNMLLKNLVARTRPYEVIDGLRILVERQHDLSFPSGHAGSAFSAVVVLVLWLRGEEGVKRRGLISAALILTALLMDFSRLYVGVHYPTDVLAGTLTGTLIAAAVYAVYRRLRERSGQEARG